MRGIGIILVILIVLGGAWYLLSGKQTNTNVTVTEQTSTVATSAPAVASSTPSAPAANAVVTYTDSGFSPSLVTVKKGQTVEFVNKSSDEMWVASGVHPTHMLYSGTSLSQHCPDTAGVAFDECGAVGNGGTYSFTFMKVGTWPYHNHGNASDTGKVTVTP